MGIKDRLLNLVSAEDEDDELEDEEYETVEYKQETKPVSSYEQPKTKGVSNVKADAKMVLFEPRSFEEAEEIARHLKSKRAAVVNLHRLPRDYAQRTIDFLTGVVFALDGTIQKVGHNVILCAPREVSIGGVISMDNIDE